MYKFYMPIGDWSADGHGKMERFLIHSNRSVEQIREAHFKIKEMTGIDIEAICSDYEENQIERCLMKELTLMGWEIKTGIAGENIPSPEDMVDLWIMLLMKAVPGLELERVDNSKDIPMLPFYGIDDQSRHINFVGYGLFYE